MADDLISRQAAIEAVGINTWAGQRLLKVPTADVVERKKGKWHDVGSLSCRCSECGCKSEKESSFCPNCGAQMDERREK